MLNRQKMNHEHMIDVRTSDACALLPLSRVVDLVERVKQALHKTDFVLPQERVDTSTFFCNESVYGKATILMVSGVVSLEK